MAELTKDEVQEEAPVPGFEEEFPRDPFGGDCSELEWGAEVNVGQLQAEVAARLGDGVRVVVSAPKYSTEGVGRPVEGEALTVFVHPAAADADAVREVLAVHRPDPYSGLSAEEVREVELMEKARSEEDMTVAEMRQALRVLARG